MKIGILTFHCVHNYGAVLQAYAMQRFLRLSGHEAFLIDYRPDYLVTPYRLFALKAYWTRPYVKAVKTIVSRFLLLSQSRKRRKGFDRFISQLPLAKRQSGKEKQDWDAFVFGSDQIWNPDLCKGLDCMYWGDFEEAKGKKKIAYAASMGDTLLTESEKEYCRKALSSFDAIGVRESSLQTLLASLLEKPIELVLDPSFLLPVSEWDKLAMRPNHKRPYVLVYQVKENPKVKVLAERMACLLDAEIVELKAWLSLSRQTPYQCATPEAFLGYFKYAACVVTTSFHGTAFSLIFNKPFYTVRLNTAADLRSASLLETLSLQSRFVEAEASLSFSDIDYTKVNERLDQLRNDSINFLQESLA